MEHAFVPRSERRAGDAGFTIWEGVVGLNVVGLAVLLFAGLFSSMEGARHDAFARQGAQEGLRRNLESVARVLRGADVTSLDGFDAGGASSSLTFTRIGTEGSTLESLRWQRVDDYVPGIEMPGRVVHVKNGEERVVAERVPRGSFSVRWDAGMLVVEVGTYHVFKDQAQTARGSTAILASN